MKAVRPVIPQIKSVVSHSTLRRQKEGKKERTGLRNLELGIS
jgi:hypothetical protein